MMFSMQHKFILSCNHIFPAFLEYCLIRFVENFTCSSFIPYFFATASSLASSVLFCIQYMHKKKDTISRK